jgi:hypothetical protein
MTRTILAALAVSAALLLVVPATGASSSRAKISGKVAAFSATTGLMKVDSRRFAHILRLPATHARIRVGQRVDLRGTTLRQHGRGSSVIARNVQVVRSISLGASSSVTGGPLAPANDDELEVKGTLAALSPVTVTTSAGSAVCVAPSGMSLSGFAVGDFVEMTCDLRAGVWTVRKLQHEDDDAARGDDDDDDRNSGTANCDRSGSEGHIGPGSCDDADEDHDNSGHGNRGDDDDHHDDHSGSGHGHDGDDD